MSGYGFRFLGIAERASEQSGERASERTGRRASGRAGSHVSGRTGSRASGRTGRRANGRTGRRLAARPWQQPSDRSVAYGKRAKIIIIYKDKKEMKASGQNY